STAVGSTGASSTGGTSTGGSSLAGSSSEGSSSGESVSGGSSSGGSSSSSSGGSSGSQTFSFTCDLPLDAGLPLRCQAELLVADIIPAVTDLDAVNAVALIATGDGGFLLGVIGGGTVPYYGSGDAGGFAQFV